MNPTVVHTLAGIMFGASVMAFAFWVWWKAERARRVAEYARILKSHRRCLELLGGDSRIHPELKRALQVRVLEACDIVQGIEGGWNVK